MPKLVVGVEVFVWWPDHLESSVKVWGWSLDFHWLTIKR